MRSSNFRPSSSFAWNRGRCRGVQVDVRCVIVVAAVALLAGCGSESPSPASGSNSRVSGHALAGPTCPVERPGDPNCEPKPVQGSVQFVQDDHVVSSVRIDAGGGFAAEIPAGAYTVTVDTGGKAFPVCAPVEVEVRADADAVVEISCDTGIR
jgi:hypothetical protein